MPVWFGSQIFNYAIAFKANIGAWNTASVTSMTNVCAAFGPADALGRGSAPTLSSLSVGVDRVWFGSQALQQAFVFNANIGAWNTASVSNMAYVCAASGKAPRSVVDALGRC
jgi:surface protein